MCIALRLFEIVSGLRYTNAVPELAQGIADYNLAGVCFRRDVISADAIRGVLIALDFERIHENERYETWVEAARDLVPEP